jgi:hypothetical protein
LETRIFKSAEDVDTLDPYMLLLARNRQLVTSQDASACMHRHTQTLVIDAHSAI